MKLRLVKELEIIDRRLNDKKICSFSVNLVYQFLNSEALTVADLTN